MPADRYGGYPAIFSGASAFNLNQLDGINAQSGNSVVSDRPMGALAPAAHMLGLANTRAIVSTTDLTSIIQAAPIGGTTLGYDAESGATLQYQQRENRSAFTTGSTHMTATSPKGFLWIDTITARTGVPVRVAATYQGLWTGDLATPPLLYQTGQALTNAPAHTAFYFQGDVRLNSAAFTGVEDITITSGINVRTIMDDGAVYPIECFIDSVTSVVSMTVKQGSTLASLGLYGLAMAGALDVYFWKGLPGKQRTDKTAPEHVQVTIPTGAVFGDGAAVQDVGDNRTRFMFRATDILTQAFDVPIPAVA